MTPFRNVIAISAFFFNLTATAHSYASHEVEDLIDIFESNGVIVAVIEGKVGRL
jgi:hypothetical protein